MIQFHEITIIGMGLIGGSLALALKKSGYKGKIIGCDKSLESLIEAKSMGAIDDMYEVPKESVKSSDLVIIAVPLGCYNDILQEIGPYLSKDTIVTDVGSVKGYAELAVTKNLPKEIQFLGGHPMAGSEKGGIKASTPFLYENAYYFLTPNENTKKNTIDKLENLVKSIGAFPVIIKSNEHDKIVANISHIPHLTAAMLVNLLHENGSTSDITFAGGGFRDSTRIASGNPSMWKDILFFNKEEVIKSIEVLENILKNFRRGLDEYREEEVLENLKSAKELRDKIPHNSKDYIPPIYDLIIDVQDRPGVLAELTHIIGVNKINIKEIEILHAREEELGAVRIGLSSKDEQKKAFNILKDAGFHLIYRKGDI